MTSSRWLAFKILMAVEAGEFASDLIEREARDLDGRDAGLLTELVFGVLRHKGQLDWMLAGRTRHLDDEVRVALELGLYQRLYLTRIPPHAAVSESVEIVRAAKKGSASGLVNAILRRARMPREWPDRAVGLSMPAWLLERWDREYGPELAEMIAEAALKKPEEFRRGERVMDLGSQKVAEMVTARPGERVLDLCAAPGNKTAVMQETGAWVVACDASPSRLRGMLAEAPRVRLDATKPLPFGPVFDWVLVDAPCSGTGTLARNPEIRWRLTPEEIERQAERQRLMLRNALACRKPGGKLVYATCSLEREENQAVVAWLGLEPSATLQRLPGRDPGDGFQAFIL